MSTLDLAVIGNCSIGALLDERARFVWAGMPRFDSDPPFCSLLDGGANADSGIYEVELFDFRDSTQSYCRNSAVVMTHLFDGNDGVVEIVDFAPRFKQYGRVYRPNMLVRTIRPLAGTPRVRIRLHPTYGYGEHTPETTRGTNHIRFLLPEQTLRVTTDGPVSYIMEGTPFVLETPVTLVLGPDESLTDAPGEVSRDFFEKTDDYWQDWCRSLALPFEWQEAVIRAAITLKLCNFEETGAIVAAMTTSIPEAPDSGRNWDYRYCWLRDSYFVVHALNALNATKTMEGFLNYISNIVVGAEDGYLQPVFGITLEKRLEEREVTSLRGYRAMGPVRVGNSAYEQVQNDGYGSVVLTTAQMFFDSRLSRPGDESLFHRLERLGDQAVRRWNQPDAGPWELRTREAVHTYSSLLCWAACDRLSKIARRLRLDAREKHWRNHAARIRKGILKHAWNPELNSFTGAFDDHEIDASLLLMPQLGFLPADDPRFLATLEVIERELRDGSHLNRYASPDDFGQPETSFNVCTFWYIDALCAVGRMEEARELFENMLASRNSLGLLSEDLNAETGELWGNFPQTYSMVGLIHSAARLSKPWEEAF